jgi:flagellar hook-length control protein FliK
VPGRPPVAVQRIVEAAVQLRPEKVTRLHIALHPESLGELLIELVLRGGVLHGVVQTVSESEKNLVAAHLGRLRTSLEGKGIAVGELRVTVAGDSAEEPEGPRSLRRGRVDLLA